MSDGRRTWMRWMWRGHRLWWRVSGGRLGNRVRGLPVLELTTTGRRSGEPRSVLLNYLPHGGGFAVIASNAGAADDPAWWSNLRAEPRGEVRTRAGRVPVAAELLDGPGREEVWAAAVRANPDYAGYAMAAGRPIPVVLLRPATP
jgi:deazaflavin-dependent oxidoreductase (nitroreductase family)